MIRDDLTFIERLEHIKEKHLKLSYETTWSFSRKAMSETRLYIKLYRKIDKLKENLRLKAYECMLKNHSDLSTNNDTH